MPAPSPQGSKDIHAKALAINLEASYYGTFAEIGAGQEVARWFLSVGAASGTVAEAISAYDKTVSDDRYGTGTRYVSKERLVAMLDFEFKELVARLGTQRGAESRFFAFADTVATRNYQGNNEQHGWLGFRFQTQPNGPPNQILLHISLLDPTAQLQQQAVGTLGVNLIYAAHLQRSSPKDFLAGLFDDLSIERLEIDVLEFSGPEFDGMDARLWCLDLLRMGMCHVLVFDPKAQLVEPATPLHKRPLLVERTLGGHPGPSADKALEAAKQKLLVEKVALERDPIYVLEISLTTVSGTAASDNAALLAQIEQLSPMGTVLVTHYPEGYQVLNYLRRYTAEPIRVIVWLSTFFQLLAERVFTASPGAILEGFGRLLSTDVTVYVSPMEKKRLIAELGQVEESLLLPSAGDVVTLDDFHPKPPLDHLFLYLRGAGHIVPLDTPAAS
jgi:hypothetical protein